MAQPMPARPEGSRRASSAITKRASLLPKPSSVVFDPSALIAQHAQLTGTHPITIGPRAVLHPHSKVSSMLAPVVLGEGVIVYERAKIGLGTGDAMVTGSQRNSISSAKNSVREPMRVEGTVLGKNVVVETGAVVEAAEVGEGTMVEANAYLGRGSVLGKFCIVSAHCNVAAGAQLPDYTVLFSGSERRVDKTLQARPQILEMKTALHTKQLENFTKLLPNYASKWS